MNRPGRVTVKLEPGGLIAKGVMTGTRYIPRFGLDAEYDPCVYCLGPSDTHEHVIPQSKGGRRKNNIARACEECNRERGSKPLLAYLTNRLERGVSMRGSTAKPSDVNSNHHPNY